MQRSMFLALALVVATASGCSGASSNEVQGDESAITAAEANERSQALKDHVLAAVPAGTETQAKLGIKTWDVFAGTDAASGFDGAVFYASDAAGDARYVFAVDAVTKKAVVAILAKDGTTVGDAKKLDLDAYSLLLTDVSALRDRLAGMTGAGDGASAASSRCAIGLAAAGLTLVLVAGIPFLAAATAYVGFVSAAAATMGELGGALLALDVGLFAADALVVTYAGAILSAAADAPSACAQAARDRRR